MHKNKEIQIIASEDGSHTLYNRILDETYHSIHGAKTESLHVFINSGIRLVPKKEISIMEIGMGTGLNALLTYLYQKSNDELQSVYYHALELYPLPDETIEGLNYIQDLSTEEKSFFRNIHSAEWNKETILTDEYTLHKIQADLIEFTPNFMYDVIYFDAFAPDVQPQLWAKEIFRRLYEHLNLGGVLTTYSAKGQLRRDLIEVGFRVERRPGPPGKREMIVAFKDSVQ